MDIKVDIEMQKYELGARGVYSVGQQMEAVNEENINTLRGDIHLHLSLPIGS